MIFHFLYTISIVVN